MLKLVWPNDQVLSSDNLKDDKWVIWNMLTKISQSCDIIVYTFIKVSGMKSVGVFWSEYSAQSSVNCCQSNYGKMQSYNKQDEHLPSNQMKFILPRESNICVWATLELQHKITLLKKGSSSGQAHIPHMQPHVRAPMINSWSRH